MSSRNEKHLAVDQKSNETAALQMQTPVRARVQLSPSFSNKLFRCIWILAYLVFYRLTPVPMHGWRCILLRAFGAEISKGALPYPAAKIWAPWNLQMKRNACIANGANCYNVAKILLEEDCIVSQGAYLCSASHDFRQPGFPLTAAKIEIGDKAWVAADAFIGPGVLVGNNSVVGARSVVLKSVPEKVVVAGNPARVVSRVFD